MVYLLFYTGKCAAEVAEIRPGDLNREDGVLQVRGEGSCRRRVNWPTVGDGGPAQWAQQQ